MRTLSRALSILTFAASAAGYAAETEPKLLMTQRGAVLFQDDLSRPPGKEWTGKPGRWETVEGALQGAEVAADRHAAVRRRAVPFQNAICQYEFRLLGARQTTFSINDARGHVCRVLIRPDGFTVQKDDHDHAGPDRPVVFEKKQVALQPGRWYTLVIEILGEEMLAQIENQVGFGSDALVASPKTNIGFTVSGEAAQFRNLRVWEALPNASWPETRRRLIAARGQ